MTCCTLIDLPNSLKIVHSRVANYHNLPFSGRATRGSWVRLPREGNTWSHHQCLFEGNVGKTGMCGLQTLSVKGLRVVFTHGEGISTLRVHHMGWQPLIKCARHDFKITYFPFFMFLCILLFLCLCFSCLFMFFTFLRAFLYFLSFSGRQWCFPRSYVFVNYDEEIRPT